MSERVYFFKRFPFFIGQKINIKDGHRKGDWEVIGVDEKKVTLKCPVSGIKVEWDRFCYHLEERDAEWPAKSQ